MLHVNSKPLALWALLLPSLLRSTKLSLKRCLLLTLQGTLDRIKKKRERAYFYLINDFYYVHNTVLGLEGDIFQNIRRGEGKVQGR